MNKIKIYIIEIIIIIAILLLILGIATAETLTASWYSVDSCRREGTSGIMANGKEFKDEGLTCASWDYIFGTKLRIHNLRNNNSVVVAVTDRGPAKRLYRMGRVIDLSRAAFDRIADLSEGVVEILIEVIE